MSNNVIDMFSSTREIEMSRFRKGGFKRGVFDAGAIDPSREISQIASGSKLEFEHVVTDHELRELSTTLQELEMKRKDSSSSLNLYNQHGNIYSLTLESKTIKKC